MRFVISEAGAPLWQQASDLVLKVYAELFGASIHGHTDAFLVAQNEETGEVQGCAGIGYGIGRPFFLEHYFPVPAQEVVSRHTGIAVPRRKLMELGPIVSSEGGAGRAIMKMMPYLAEETGKFGGLFTATSDLVLIMKYLRFPFEPLVVARQDMLPKDEQAGWGNYYDTKPTTGLIRLPSIKEALGLDKVEPPPKTAYGSYFEHEEVLHRAVA